MPHISRFTMPVSITKCPKMPSEDINSTHPKYGGTFLNIKLNKM